jgi:hypothetical protein
MLDARTACPPAPQSRASVAVSPLPHMSTEPAASPTAGMAPVPP